MNKIFRGLLVLGAIVGLIVFFSTVFVVHETEQIVITRMGKPVRTITNPGLAFKMPFMESATIYSTQLLDYDAEADEVITKDKKPLLADTFAKWRIMDPIKFLQTVRTQSGAQPRLDDIIYSVAREELGSYTFSEIIRSKDLMLRVTEKVNEQAKEYGVEVVDVRIKRADLPEQNQKSVYANMASEREQMAAKYLSEGDKEALKIRSASDRQVKEIIANAYRESQTIVGEGEAEAARIYAEAYKKDPEFYGFLKALETYRTTFKGETTMMVPANSELARYLLGTR